ncbi:ABC transporter ATP-binding protein [Leucobacter chinensis]|uniref:ABC transporter ATP-binding protein n=1 Tax=Leucobacter chinensis TaxID=2851010 RepID=UPI001C23F447|nr:ABC transporter ATP-binding protein [Leucobacter chinensis]
MIRTFLSLVPAGLRRTVRAHTALTVVSVIARALGAVLLVPLVAALFSAEPAKAWPWVGLLAAVTLLGWVIDWTVAKLGFAIGFTLLETGQQQLADRLTRVKLGWLNHENTARSRQAIAATGPDMVGLVTYLITPLVTSVLLPIVIGIALLPISMVTGFVALALVPVLLGTFWLAGRLTRAADREAAAANSAFTERLVEFARTQQALRASRRVAPGQSHAGEALEAQHRSMTKLILMQIPGEILFSIASQIALIALAATVVWQTVSGNLQVPEAIALIVVIVRYLEPFTALAELSGALEGASGMLRDIRAVLEAPAVQHGESEEPAAGAVEVVFHDVSFAYDAATPVLDKFSVRLEPGSTTAIVGPSGSGKSTVLGLLAGLYEPTAGTIKVNETPLDALTADARERLVSMVFQEPYLFDGTLAANVAVGNPAASDEELGRALSLARLTEVTNAHPDGVALAVGEGGSRLSGGERQRVSIARALAKPASILLIDEATSALDTENEAAVAEALTGDETPRTRVIVAHRLASIRAADRVLFLEGGRIVEDGSIEALIEADGRFAEFWRRQMSASDWRVGAVE